MAILLLLERPRERPRCKNCLRLIPFLIGLPLKFPTNKTFSATVSVGYIWLYPFTKRLKEATKDPAGARQPWGSRRKGRASYQEMSDAPNENVDFNFLQWAIILIFHFFKSVWIHVSFSLGSSITYHWGVKKRIGKPFWPLNSCENWTTWIATMSQCLSVKALQWFSAIACHVMTISHLCTTTAQAQQSFELWCSVAEVI